jgi:hypothetical protein
MACLLIISLGQESDIMKIIIYYHIQVFLNGEHLVHVIEKEFWKK